MLPKVPGYSETFFHSLINGLQSAGHQVILFTNKPESGHNNWLIKPSYLFSGIKVLGKYSI